MKTIKKISVLFVATVISSFALSCSSSDDGGGPGDAAEGPGGKRKRITGG